MVDVVHDALHVLGEDACHKVKADQVVIRLKLPDLSVLSPIGHFTETTTFHQEVLLKAYLALKE